MERKNVTILGISASGRNNGIVNQTVAAILKETGFDYEIVTLAGKTINGCSGCLSCVKDNRCVLKDNFTAISDKMIEADGIVFGSPTYYGTVSARAHALMERAAYSFHHREVFTLRDKPCVSVSTEWVRKTRNLPGDPVKDMIEKIFIGANKMKSIGHVTAYGYGCCYSCGYGHNCAAGAAMTEKSKRIGRFEKEDLPPEFCNQADTHKQVKEAALALRNEFNVYK
jgi:multimeric flavodoxin WrbA